LPIRKHHIYICTDSIYRPEQTGRKRNSLKFPEGVAWIVMASEYDRPAASHCQTLSHNVVSSTPHNVSGDMHCKSNYHATTTTSRIEDKSRNTGSVIEIIGIN
jgi:hypothetical protein